ncbi:MAG: 50S ribosome-binding GTPase, partial [Woeseiaceae bacterium]
MMVEQTIKALREADAAIVMVDGRSGITAADEHVAELARRHAKKTWLAVNKAEGLDVTTANADFYGLGFGEPIAVSAAHGDRIAALMDEVLAGFEADESAPEADDENELRIAIIGRPNVGKSTLANRLLGEERLVVYDRPGTTRDTVEVPFERDDRKYMLIDTAGIRRKSRVSEAIEKFSIVKALQ